jgi:uncharacterized alkaline shock family protein YloU
MHEVACKAKHNVKGIVNMDEQMCATCSLVFDNTHNRTMHQVACKAKQNVKGIVTMDKLMCDTCSM